MILIVDFGSQTTHLIARRLKEIGVQTTIITPDKILQEIKKIRPSGIVLSGGPSSVYEKGAPSVDVKIFNLGIPILGICYGLQLTAYLLGGKVISGKKEYGPSQLEIGNLPASPRGEKLEITKDLSKSFVVWMSHGDEVITLPKGFKVIGSSDGVPFAFVENKDKKIYGLQFHPEVEHTENGITIFRNFIQICGLKIGKKKFNLGEIKEDIRKQVGSAYVIGAISGGVDSTVAGILAADAIGKHFIPVYVDNGFMRGDTTNLVSQIFKKHGIRPIVANVQDEALKILKGVKDPEGKRKIIGKLFIDVFEREMKKQIKAGKNVKFLLQGTIYSDVIESKGTKYASKIKSHHNVAGLPKHMKLKLLEPVRNFYKDEVREIGKLLKLPEEFVQRQKFPGPGYAIRIRGEVTSERLSKERIADLIVMEEIEKAGWLSKVFHSFPVMTGAMSTAVKGDGRFFGEVVALRVTISSDEMTSGWAHLPYALLQKISSRIINEVPNISRVVYDITSKPPATMEWE